jgi:putative MATE family efflux protein
MQAIQPVESQPSLWTTIREAIAGSHHGEYTDGPIGRAILLLAIPMVLELVLESVFAVVDVFFVSRIGPDAIATVGVTESMLTIIYAVAIGLSAGATATVARRIGERDREGAALAAVQAILLAIAIAIPVGAFGALFASPLLAAMGAGPDVIAHASYTRVVLGMNGVVLLLFLINAVFRGAGDAAIAMRVLWIANAINIVLDPCFIFGLGPFPRLGVTGAAVATTTGRGIAVAIQMWLLFKGGDRIPVRARHLRVDPRVMLNMVRLSGTAVVQMLIGMTSYIGVVRIIATFGSAALAGATITIRVVIFAVLPAWGLSNAAATLVGQNLGAGKPERAETSVWRASLYNAIFLAVLSVFFVTFTEFVVGIFTTDAAVVAIAVRGLRIIAGGFMFYAVGYVATQAFNGAGDAMTPTLINLGCFWFGEIPLAYILGVSFGYGPTGVFWAMNIAFSVMSIVSALLFRRGTWKTARV